MDPYFLARLIESLLTLYMLLILLRWLGKHIGFNMEEGRWRILTRLTDPLLKGMRGILPNMGPVDFAPIAVLFLVWLIRIVMLNTLMGFASSTGS